MKIVGDVFIGKNLKKIKIKNNKKFLIYCAGISNSKTKDKKILKKEINKFYKILEITNSNLIFIYISTTSIKDPYSVKNLYVKNKIKIEKIIKSKLKKYIIIRLPQIIGRSKNPYILSNYLYQKIKFNIPFKAWVNVRRNFLDIDDIKKIITKIINNYSERNLTINILNSKSISVEEIIDKFNLILKRKALFKPVSIKDYDKTKIINSKNEKNFIFRTNKNYLTRILKKYYR